jgi:hypothetical protein
MALQTGCRQQAFSEVYFQNMALENRALEDRIYEYDSEYRALENELDAAQRANARLRQQLAESQQDKGTSTNRLFRPRGSNPTPPPSVHAAPDVDFSLASPIEPPIVSPIPESIPSVLQIEPSQPNTTTDSNSPGRADSPSRPGPVAQPDAARPDATAMPGSTNQPAPNPNTPAPFQAPFNPFGPTAPAGDVPRPDSGAPSKPDRDRGIATQEPETLPSILPGNTSPPRIENLPSLNPETRPGFQPAAEGNPFPSPTLGSPQPSTPTTPMPQPPSDRDRNSTSAGQITIPGLLEIRPQRKPVSVSADNRIVEIGFHPALCRANDGDGDSKSDGLYLVLQPRNASGQFVEAAGEASIVILDPQQAENRGRIGQWSFSEAEIRKRMQPLGSSQGIHLTLDWQKQRPLSDRVTVLVRYSLPDKRTLVNEREIHLPRPGTAKSAWMPRAPSKLQLENHTGPMPSVVPAAAWSPDR